MEISFKAIREAFVPISLDNSTRYSEQKMKELNKKNVLNTIKHVSEGNINSQNGYVMFQEEIEQMQNEVVKFNFNK